MASKSNRPRLETSYDILTCTIKDPPFSYIELELATDSTETEALDNLQIKSYCTAALQQYLGLTGMAISVDILKVDGSRCWLRIPRPDLSSFTAAITAYGGIHNDGVRRVLRVKQSADWLGLMLGADAQEQMWKG